MPDTRSVRVFVSSTFRDGEYGGIRMPAAYNWVRFEINRHLNAALLSRPSD
jgi:hypothetical protein